MVRFSRRTSPWALRIRVGMGRGDGCRQRRVRGAGREPSADQR